MAAWYPWKSPTGIPCSDSCGIFCLNKLGQYYPKVGRHQLDIVVRQGLYPNHHEIRVHQPNNAPGCELKSYLPKQEMDLKKTISETFLPSDASTAVAVNENKGDKVLQIVEKRLEVELWRVNGTDRGGCQFPIMFYTQTMGRRSADANERRLIKTANMKKKTGSLGRASSSSQWHASNYSSWSWKD